MSKSGDEMGSITQRFPALRRYFAGTGKLRGFRRLNTVGGSEDCKACRGTGKDGKGRDCKSCAGTGTATEWR